jgi:SAM-dependent methyltransferase
MGDGTREPTGAGETQPEPDWVPPGVDTKRANVARIYDYWLGGTHNFLADQDVGRAIAAVEPRMRALAQANRAFLGRAVRFLAGAGVDQFLDVGSGIPTSGNVHEIAQEANPVARVAYVDIDPVAIAHSKAILAGNEHAAIADADLREPEKILAHNTVGRLIDFSRPVGLILLVVLQFVSDIEDPWQIVATLRDALAPGSYLVLGHATDEGSRPSVAQAVETVYNRSVATQIQMRSATEIQRMFDGFELVDPGLVYTPRWRPEAVGDVPEYLANFGVLVGVARKP